MATGIVSIAALQQRLIGFAWALFVANAIIYALLWTLLLTRIVSHLSNLAADLADPHRGPDFFTLVAGSAVLGAQFLVIPKLVWPALVLGYMAIALWLVLTYGFFTAVIVAEEKHELARRLNGSWLLAVVATQSISALGSLLSPHFGPNGSHVVLLLSLALYLVGAMEYILIMGMVFNRLVVYVVTPAELSAPYWINMGALAITTLAGSYLILASIHWHFLRSLLHFLNGLTILFWAAGSWWIPLLLLLGYWRHVRRRYPLRYATEYWAVVFPLGMYTAATYDLARATGLRMLFDIPRYSVYVAIAAWALLSIALVYELAPRISPRPTGHGDKRRQ